jgi:ABC-type branched-subunit amino acid transport system substrate-binding protein
MKKLLLVSMIMVGVVGLMLGGSGNVAAAPKTLEVGIATPLSGPVGFLGANYQNAVLLAIENQNKKGGVTIGGQKYMLKAIIRDDKFDPAVGKTVAEELVYDKKVKVIFGPTMVEAGAMQAITEPNKVLLFCMAPMPGLTSPEHPYSFFAGGYPAKQMAVGASYIKKFYPKAKTAVSTYGDIPDAPLYFGTAKAIYGQYGFTWLADEQYPYNITDFAPIVARIMAKKPDMVNITGSGGGMGPLMGLFTKQLREGGFKGIIWMPTVPPPGIMDTVPKAYLTKIVTNDIALDSPIVSQAYKDVYNQYVKEFGTKPIDFFSEAYNGVNAFFEFLNTQDTMDTTAWMEGFANYRWQSIFGYEASWIGKPVFGINRFLVNSLWVSEWKNGKLETNFVAPIPEGMIEGK